MRALLLLVALSGCAIWDGDPSRPPAQDVRVHYVADSQGICRQIAGAWDLYLGCAWWNRVYASCDIFVPTGAPGFVLDHERKHCDGYDH